MKVKFPKGHGESFSVEGKDYAIDKDGIASGLTAEHAAIAASFGAESLSVDDKVDEERTELEELLDGNVEEVKAALDDLSDDDLTKLRGFEEKGKTRKTVIEAIDAELDARNEE
jgi:hypothetical protein